MKEYTTAKEYWDSAYHDGDVKETPAGQEVNNLTRRRARNYWLTQDFLLHMHSRPTVMMKNLFQNSNSALEVGCGTGEFIAGMLAYTEGALVAGVGIDLSDRAIDIALNDGGIPIPEGKSLDYGVGDMNEISLIEGIFDIIIANQVIEHFKDPVEIVKGLQKLGRHVLVITPYKERVPPLRAGCIDGDDDHKVSIDEFTYRSLPVIEDLVFFSKEGWGVSRKGECPLQYAVLIEGSPPTSTDNAPTK